MWTIVLASLVAASRGPTIPMRVETPLHAQHMLADALATAESVDWVIAGNHRVSVIGLEIIDAGPGPLEPGDLSWLTDVIKDRASITRLLVTTDGNVTLVTDDGEQYQALPGHGSNASVEARWAASWNA